MVGSDASDSDSSLCRVFHLICFLRTKRRNARKLIVKLFLFLACTNMVKKSTTDPLGGYVENAEALLTLLQEDADLLKSSAKGGEKFNKGKRAKVRLNANYVYLNLIIIS